MAEKLIQEGVNGQLGARARLEIERQLREYWLAGLNHEIRTPLAGILGMVELLLETSLDGNQRECAQAARQCAETLLCNVNMMLEYSALSAGTVRADNAEFHLGMLLQEAVEEQLLAAHDKGLRVVYHEVSDVGRFVVGDPDRLRQVIRQLLSNAVKFTHAGTVEVRAVYTDRGRSGTLAFSVRDTGIGISDADLGRIFSGFSQVESGLARRYSGLGLGLALSKRILGLLGGSIVVDSEPSRGSVFSFEVPLKSGVETPDWRPRAQTGVSSQRILLVEDNRISQRIVIHLLRKHDYEADCAESGPEAVEACSRKAYGLVLMDLQLPGMDGFEVTRRVRALPGSAGVFAARQQSCAEFALL